MKKFFSIMLLSAIMIFSNATAQADFDLNKDFNFQLVPMSFIYSGRVVNISTYLSVRERPTVNSREIVRIPNGTRLTLRDSGPVYNTGWWEVLSINSPGYEGFEGYNGFGIGYVNARYIYAWQ